MTHSSSTVTIAKIKEMTSNDFEIKLLKNNNSCLIPLKW